MNKKLFCLLFFISGLCGLMYQILWTRLFSFVLGNTYLTISMIVAGFMFGLFAGSWLAGRYLPKIRSGLFWYGILELIIGGYAILLIIAFAMLESLFAGLHAIFKDIEAVHTTVRVLTTTFLLLIPTAAMGATLPVAMQTYTTGQQLFGENISLFYAINTIGGAVGVFLAGFFLIEYIGVSRGIVLTGTANIVIGLVALLLGRRNPAPEEQPEQQSASPAKRRKSQVRSPQMALPVTAFVWTAGASGFAALCYEIIWSRGLKFVIHNSTYSFAVILCTFLVAIALGSRIAKKLGRSGSSRLQRFGLLQLGVGLYAIFSIYLLYGFCYSEFFQNTFINIIYDFSYSWHWAIVIYCLVCAIMFFAPVLFMGILFPLLNELYYDQEGVAPGGTVSKIYAVNTFGGILGSLAAGFLILPALGIRGGIYLIAAINLTLGAFFVIKSKERVRLTLLSAIAVLFLFIVTSMDTGYLYGRGENQRDTVLFYEEGLMASVKVFDRAGRRQKSRFMSIDGNIIASTHQTLLKKEKLIAHLPFLAKPDIRDVLAVGLASGISVGSMTLYEQVEKVDCVELVKPVFPAAALFGDYNYDLFNNTKVTIYHNDIYGFLKYRNDKYDLISSDGKLGTLYSGNTIMLSKDFYELCKGRMSQGAMFIQWLPIITPSDELKDVMNTLSNSFAHVLLFYFYPTDILMLASESPIRLDAEHIDALLANSSVRRDLSITGIEDSETMLAAFAGTYDLPEESPIEINSFDRPFLEFRYMRQWKKGRDYEGGYRARNLQFLLKNLEAMKQDELQRLVPSVDVAQLESTIAGTKLFWEGGVEYFKTGQYQRSFAEYFEYRQALQMTDPKTQIPNPK